MPVIVKKTCDQTIVEVYTCPAPAGEVVPYIGVNIGDGPGEIYESTDQDVAPREHKFRTLKLQNLGSGARVFKQTDTTATTVDPKLRSIVAGDNVTVEELANEIRISSTGGGGGGTGGAYPDTVMAATSAEICSNRVGATPVTLTYTPATDTPAAIEGHLAVIVTYFQGDLVAGDGNTSVTGLTGWTLLAGSGMHMFTVHYKFLTIADLNNTFTYTLDAEGIKRGCRVVYVVDNVNTEAPFYSFVTDYFLHGFRRVNATTNTMGMAVPSPAFSTGQHAITITHSRDYNSAADAWSDMNLMELGEVSSWADLNIVEKSFPYIMGDIPCMQFRIVSRKANINLDENLIPGETVFSSMQDPSWATAGVSVSRPNTYLTALTGTGTGKHYAEQTLALTAGERVTFYVYFKEDGSYPNAVYKAHMYIVDPSNNERGVWVYKDGGPVNLFVSGFIDPLSDRNTVWRHCAYEPKQDGNPSVDGMVLALYLTAPTSGNYKFRFGPAYGANGTSTSFTAAGGLGSTVYVSHAGIRKGYHSARRVWTPDGAVSGVGKTGLIDNPGYLLNVSDQGANPFETQQFTMVFNPSWIKYPVARISADLANVDSPGQNVIVSGDSYTIPNPNTPLADDYQNYFSADKYVHPMQGGVVGKYYWEARVDVVTDANWFSNQIVGIVPPLNPGVSDWNINSVPGIGYDAYVNGDGGLAVNDVIGVAMDFQAGEVKFYRNNVLKKTVAMTATIPWCAYAMAPPAFGRPQGQWTIRLRAPFTYTPPAGFVEYDITGSSDFKFGTNTVNVGGGAEILVPGDPDTYRTILSGDGISVTQEEKAIRIAQDIPDLPLMGGGIADKTADTIAIYDNSAGVHKRITPQEIVDAAGGAGGSGGTIYVYEVLGAQSLLHHLDGANSATSAVDVQGRTWSQFGSGGALSTTLARFGSSSLYISGATPRGFAAPANAISIGSGTEFLMEMRVYIVSFGGSGDQVILLGNVDSASDGGSNREWQLWLQNSTTIRFYTGQRGSNNQQTTVTIAALATNMWHHIAVGRNLAGTILFWVDGTRYIGNTNALSISHATKPWRIGYTATSNSTGTAEYYIDELRVITDGCPYKDKATITVPNTPFNDTFASDPVVVGQSGNKHPDNPPVAPDVMDDEFNSGSLNAKWVWRNQGGATAVPSAGALTLTAPTSGTENLRIIEQPVTGAWKVRAKCSAHVLANYNSTGLCVVNSTNGRIISHYKVHDSATGNEGFGVAKYSSATLYTSGLLPTQDYADRYGASQSGVYFEIEYDGTTLYFRTSGDGVVFDTVASEAAATFLGTPDRVGLLVSAGGNVTTPATGVFDWFRKIGTNYDVVQTGGGSSYSSSSGGGGGEIYAAARPATTPATEDEEFSDTSLNAKWTVRQTAGSVVFSDSCLVIPTGATRRIDQPLVGGPTTTFKIRAKFWLGNFWGHNNHALSMYIHNSANGWYHDWGWWRDGGSSNILVSNRFSTGFAWAGVNFNSGMTNAFVDAMHPYYWEIEGDGTNIHFRRSRTGHDSGYHTEYTRAFSSELGTVSHIGFFASVPSSGRCLIDWIRRVA